MPRSAPNGPPARRGSPDNRGDHGSGLDIPFASDAARHVDAIFILVTVDLINAARVIGLAAERRLPALYLFRLFAADGGLISYSPNSADLSRRAGSYSTRSSRAPCVPICRLRAADRIRLAIKATGASVPLVFVVGQDPVRAGLVESMNRPGKATGVNFFTGDLGGKRLELLCGMVPSARLVGLLLNPRSGPEGASQHRHAVATASEALGCQLVVQEAATDGEIEAGFVALAKAGVTALVVQNDPFFDSRRGQIIALSSRHRLPGIFHIREFPAAGGLMSYGASLSEAYRQLGNYAGKLLRGAKADDLPVLRPTKFELVVNTQTAKTFGIAVPQPVLIASDELIE